MSPSPDDTSEWLEADGLGGFASGTASGVRTRRYHALLLPATVPPGTRVTLVNGFDAWVETGGRSLALTTQRYEPDVLHPDGARRIARFDDAPWPRWTYRLDGALEVVHEIFVARDPACTVLTWRLGEECRTAKIRLSIRLFLSGRDYHGLHHQNDAFRFDADVRGQEIRWQPYDDLPGVVGSTNGSYAHDPQWYRNFLYSEERARGLDCVEDLASPGVLRWECGEEAVLVLASGVDGEARLESREASSDRVRRLRSEETARRAAAPTELQRAADAYVVRGRAGRTIIAGYPWFTDWGRDTFIALRGLCLATGRFEAARDILLSWSEHISEGMLPNRFPDAGSEPEFNSVDASLWYVIAVGEYLRSRGGAELSAAQRGRLSAAVEAILDGYGAGTRYGIRADSDGLLAAGQPGVQLTWMDAKVGDWVVTPRIGKPVEVQALWLNALRIGASGSRRFEDTLERGRRSFTERFWNEERGFLHDVVDVDHASGAVDPALRPNQIFAVGGLPSALLDGDRARRVVDVVEAHLWTPLGLRSLGPGEPSYVGRYEGSVRERDGAYHQGTVWPWLTGAFVEAWLRVRGPRERPEARRRFLQPLRDHLADAGLGHVSEIADGDAPHTPRGCPFQAWSVGELLRLEHILRNARA